MAVEVLSVVVLLVILVSNPFGEFVVLFEALPCFTLENKQRT